MTRRAARVIRVDGDTALVALEPASCDGCRAAAGCREGALFRWSARPAVVEVAVPSAPGDRPGRWITVGLAPAALLRAAGWTYGLPLVLLLAGIGLGTGLAGEGGAAAGALIGLGTAAVLLTRYVDAVRRPLALRR